MLNGVVLLWFSLVAVFTLYVAIDIRSTPEAAVMKWGFVVITLYSGPFGALLYALSCREPLPGTHEAYVAVKWRQVVGSTMHCVAGDGIGILVAAGITSALHLPRAVDLVAEYAAGFLFGWTIFQALFMKGMAGGSYSRSLRATFLPEFLSMNGVMAGMTLVMVPWMSHDHAVAAFTSPSFWFVMSVALMAGFVVAFPINWWLVDRGLKHGMTTVRTSGEPVPVAAALAAAGHALHSPATAPGGGVADAGGEGMEMPPPPRRAVLVTAGFATAGLLAMAVTVGGVAGNLTGY
ncbi:MAG: hypothetical protein NVSMB29_00060 [Candidatus Dormibacteria bacterium]